MNNYHSLLVTLLILFSFNNTFAVQALSTDELTSHCDHYADNPGGKDAIFCVRYIQGFIDGAVATDEQVTRNVVDEFGKKETFSERAIRTRAPKELERYGPTFYAEFCLGEPVPLVDVVDKVINDLQKQITEKASTPLAREMVYQSLRDHYPCRQSHTKK